MAKKDFGSLSTKKSFGTSSNVERYKSLAPKQETSEQKMDDLWVESTAPNVLPTANKNITTDFKPLNISQFVKGIKESDAGKKASLSYQNGKLREQIEQKEKEYNKANNISDWSKKNEEKSRIQQELNALNAQLDSNKQEYAKLDKPKLISGEQVEQFNKQAPLPQKIDIFLKNDLPRTTEKVGRTAMDLVGNVLSGSTNALEGMVDTGVGNIGALASTIADKTGNDDLASKIKSGAENFVKFNFSGEEMLEEKKNEGTGIYEPEILGIKVRDALNTISNMVTAGVTGGTLGFIGSAAGQNIEEALLDNQSLNRAVVYGDISGVIEGLTEKMFDTVKLLGGGKLDKFLPKSAIGKLIGGGSIGEGIEEVISGGINPLLKKLTYEQGTYELPEFWDYVKMLGESFWNGAVIGLIMKGGQDISTPQFREQYKQDVYTAVDKSKLPDNIKEQVKEAMLTPAQAQINQDLGMIRNSADYQRTQQTNMLPTYSQIQQANLAQNQANQQQNIETQQTTRPNQNNAKNQLKNDINDLNISQDEKQNLIETLNSTELNTDVNSNTTENKYISPLTNIQEATDFVSKASTNDINTLKQMLQEVEKNPNRIDLQFFAEKVKKKIEYLTKSQSYQRNKVATLAKSLEKTYGLDGKLVKEALNKYIETYNEGGDIAEARKTFLNTLNPNALLGKDASNKINRDIDNFNKELDTIKRYDEDRIKTQEAKERNKQIANTSKEEVAELYKQKKTYQTAADKAMQRILLTKSDGVQLDRLLKGEITFDQLPKGANVDQIRKAYDVKKPLSDVNKQIQDYNKAVKEQRNEKMRELTKNSAKWKDKNTGLSYAMETQERNISDIAPAEDAQRINKEIFEPIHHNEAQATRYKNGMRDKIKSLNIGIKPKYEVTYEDSQGTKTEKVSESGLVQLYGEGKIDDKVLNKLDVDTEKIKKSVSTFREIYNDLYNKTNDVLVKNGYAPVEFRKDYFPHFEETKPDTLVGKALTKLGFKMDTRELPTDIAGLTHTFKPGKKWVSNFLQRTTDVATYDAIKGFDSYIDSVADVIYHTDDIQNLRAYENALRYQHSDEVLKEQIDEVINMDIANEMKQSMIDQLYATAENSLAHYVTDLRAYTDNLAGKKTLEDRTMEHNLGRGIYNVTKNVQSRVSANMVGANISSALTNFIPLTQASAVIDTGNLLQSTWDTIKSAVKSDGFAEQSDFLTNRRGSDKLYKTATDKLSDVTNLMSLFDNFTSEVINRGRYYQNVANGMNEADARLEADKMTGNIMADRSKGSSPTLFNQSSPVTKLLTAFQLEVNNQYSYLFKDIPKEYKDKAIGKMVWAFAKMFIGAWLYNELYERMTGRRAALDPIDIVAETVGDVKEGKKASEVASGLATQVVEDIPFVGGLIGGGRLPISNALPNVGEVAKSGISLFEEGDKTKALKTIGSEMLKPVFYILPPFGGGQVKKSIEGITTYAKGGSYGVNAQGEETLKYPVEQTPGNLVKSALFGKYATEGAKNWVDSGFKSLSANQTEFYEKAKKAKIPDKLFYAAKDSQKGIEGLGDLTSLAKKNAIDRATPGLTLEKRKILYDAFNVAKSEWENTTVLTPQEIQKKKLEEKKKQEEKKKKEGK